jgi:hypothetical protein
MDITTQKAEDMNLTTIIEWFHKIYESFSAFVFSLIMTALGYFLPIRNIVHFILFLFFLDVVFGYWAAHKIKGERFKVKIIWNHTAPRIVFALSVIIGTYIWDCLFEDYISTYKIAGWFFSGLLLISILENGYYITNWKAFAGIANIVRKKIEDETGQDVGYKKKRKSKFSDD